MRKQRRGLFSKQSISQYCTIQHTTTLQNDHKVESVPQYNSLNFMKVVFMAGLFFQYVISFDHPFDQNNSHCICYSLLQDLV